MSSGMYYRDLPAMDFGRIANQIRNDRNDSPRTNGQKGDISKFQFWPTAVAMGSLIGRQFIQMLGSRCECGEERIKQGREGFQPGNGLSFLAFDFIRELLVIKAHLVMPEESLPPALRPLDAELAFDDIVSQGLHIVHKEIVPQPGRHRVLERHYEVTVTVTCRRPPRFFTAFEQNDALEDMRDGRKMPYRRRATAMDFAITGVTERAAGPIEAIPEGPCAYPTFWNTYRWTFVMPPQDYHKLHNCTNKFRLLASQEPEMDLLRHGKPIWDIQKLDAQSYQKLYGAPKLDDVRFSTRTLIEGLIAHGILKPGDLPGLFQALKTHAPVPAFQDRILESLYKEEMIRNVQGVVRGKAAYLRRTPHSVLAHLVMIRAVLVTPTRILIGPPQQEPSNSVTRRYNDKLDGIIRVQFADEEDRLYVQDYTKQADQLNPNIGITARIRRALQHGLVIGGRRFTPVASSSSQQKDHAIWFIDNKMIDGLQLRNWMGNVDETIVAKHSARMGLPFSTSRIVNIDIRLKAELPDINRNGYCFTDGVAVAGREVMRQAARALGSTRGINAAPSAIQFRLGGAKGVLGWWPDLVDDYEVRLRKSLIKFQSDLSDLNVVRLAKYQVAFLNRQFIMIMCANGVPENLLIQIFRDAVWSIRGLKDRVEDRKQTKDDYDLMSLCSDFPLSAMIQAGFNKDPLILDLAEIIECRALQDLKWRARVKLPGGVFLIGIADESGTLREGEVFCQFQESEEVEPRVVIDEVLICRAPALHPGDVRRVWAVDRPELRHLKNVIVFNTQGRRDLPNMLGGGDLDGDDYTLIWDPRLVRALKVQDPMDYTAPTPVRVLKVTQEHLNENFVQYMMNDMLGQVDNCHLAQADIKSPSHEDCMELAQIHSIAVDFQKTGVAAVLDPKLRPRLWPDFMDKDETKKIYESEKVLGKLFRIVQPDPHFRPCDIKKLGYPVDSRITRYPIFTSILERLKPIKGNYESGISYDTRRYRVFEPEILSGIAIKNRRRKRARDQNLNEPLRDSYQVHVMTAREAAQHAVRNITFTNRLTDLQLIARHAYALTFEKEYVEQWEEQLRQGMWGGRGADTHEYVDDRDEVLRPRPMISFAWVFWQELVQIATMS